MPLLSGTLPPVLVFIRDQCCPALPCNRWRCLSWCGWSCHLYRISPAAPWHAVHLTGLALLLGGDRVEVPLLPAS
jgi:hypothetical protein